MDHHHSTAERISADATRQVAQIQASFEAARARRAASSRRRGGLAVLLFIASIVGWVSVGLFPAISWLVGALPTVFLLAVVIAGRAAVVQAERNDATWREKIAQAETEAAAARTGAIRHVERPRRQSPRSLGAPIRPVAPASSGTASVPAARAGSGPVATAPKSETKPARSAVGPVRPLTDMVTTVLPATPPIGRAIHPSDAVTDVFGSIVADRGESGESTRHATGPTPVAESESEAEDGAWSPVVVPPPAYTLKPVVERAQQEEPADVAPEVVDEEVRTSGSIDLNAVLERRRASGQ